MHRPCTGEFENGDVRILGRAPEIISPAQESWRNRSPCIILLSSIEMLYNVLLFNVFRRTSSQTIGKSVCWTRGRRSTSTTRKARIWQYCVLSKRGKQSTSVTIYAKRWCKSVWGPIRRWTYSTKVLISLHCISPVWGSWIHATVQQAELQCLNFSCSHGWHDASREQYLQDWYRAVSYSRRLPPGVMPQIYADKKLVSFERRDKSRCQLYRNNDVTCLKGRS